MKDKGKQASKLSRRGFLRLLGSGMAAGTAAVTAGPSARAASTGWLPAQYQTHGRWPVQVRGRIPLASDNPAIVRDDRKCILCGQCLEVCQRSQSVYGYYELPLKNDIPCVHCGQCSLWCPTGAIVERDGIAALEAALADPAKHVVVQTAPATRVALGEEFGLPPGSLVVGQQVAALRQLGFAAVFDTNFAADLTVMEEGHELAARLGDSQGRLPQLTSCCPGWVKFCEYFYPELIAHLSTAKSPQQMLGAMVKSYYAERRQLAPQQIVSVAIMPCTAKKFECSRAGQDGLADVDIVLTTRELAKLLKKKRISLADLPAAAYDDLLGQASGAGAIFGTSGGVTEAVARTLYAMQAQSAPPPELLAFKAVRGLTGVKEATIALPERTLTVAVCQGLRQARAVLDRIKSGERRWDFVEVMACSGGCIAGGGQPRTMLPPQDELRQARSRGLYQIDASQAAVRVSTDNPAIQELYRTYLGQPGSERAERLLHTRYQDRSSQLTASSGATGGETHG